MSATGKERVEKADNALAINGGRAIRTTPMPPRLAFGVGERKMIDEVLDYYAGLGVDPGYQGIYEQRYCDKFCEFMGGGYADAVATGTAAVFVALAALDLPKNSEVLCPAISDPGTFSSIVLNGLTPRICDTAPRSFNSSVMQFAARVTDRTSCILVVHLAGYPADIEEIVAFAETRGLKVIEDCSQSHGAQVNGRKVGSFGDIAAFSAMYRKASIAGPSGGVVYSTNYDLHCRALAHADRGKPRWREGFDDRDPGDFLFPALNLHTDEISCAIGLSSLGRLEQTRAKRLSFVAGLTDAVADISTCCSCYGYDPNATPFIYPIWVDGAKAKVSKLEFASALQSEGIPLNPDYRYLASDWGWLQPYFSDQFECSNARSARDNSFMLYLNENYSRTEIADICAAIQKVETYYAGR